MQPVAATKRSAPPPSALELVSLGTGVGWERIHDAACWDRAGAIRLTVKTQSAYRRLAIAMIMHERLAEGAGLDTIEQCNLEDAVATLSTVWWGNDSAKRAPNDDSNTRRLREALFNRTTGQQILDSKAGGAAALAAGCVAFGPVTGAMAVGYGARAIVHKANPWGAPSCPLWGCNCSFEVRGQRCDMARARLFSIYAGIGLPVTAGACVAAPVVAAGAGVVIAGAAVVAAPAVAAGATIAAAPAAALAVAAGGVGAALGVARARLGCYQRQGVGFIDVYTRTCRL